MSNHTPRPAGGIAVISRPGFDDAACKGADLDLFFGRDGESEAERGLRVKEAAAICAGCPARSECGQYAAGERWGVWAGVDRERVLPVAPEPPVPCNAGLHLMTPENIKPLPGTTRTRCKACQREGDRRTAPDRRARRSRNADARNKRDRERYAEQTGRQERKAS